MYYNNTQDEMEHIFNMCSIIIVIFDAKSCFWIPSFSLSSFCSVYMGPCLTTHLFLLTEK